VGPTGIAEELERRRREAIALLQDGFMPVDVAPRLGANRRSVLRWRASYVENDKQGMTARPAPGRRSRLHAEATGRREALLRGGARACGFPTNL
jgi:transposase